MNDVNTTDSSKEKIEYSIKKLEKIKTKYPTLEEYKTKMKKNALFYNIRNINYLRNQIDIYKPHDLSLYELMPQLWKISKDINEETTRQSLIPPRTPEQIESDPFGEEVDNNENPSPEFQRIWIYQG